MSKKKKLSKKQRLLAKGDWRKSRAFRSRNAQSGYVPKPQGFEGYFYTGPSLHFGHEKSNKRKG